MTALAHFFAISCYIGGVAVAATPFARPVRAPVKLLCLVLGAGVVAPLGADEAPPAYGHQTWVRERGRQAWRMDIFREPGDASTWAYRRDPSLTAPRAEMVGVADGVQTVRVELG